MFFNSLNGLLANVSALNITLTSASDGQITVTVLPTPKKESAKALATPLQLTGTPEELDAEFANLIAQTTATRKSLAEQLEAAEAVLAAAQKEASDKAAKAVKKVGNGGKKVTPVSSLVEDNDGDGSNSDDVAAPVAEVSPVVAPAAGELTAEALFG